MGRFTFSEVLALVCRLCIGSLFVVAALGKTLDMRTFHQSISDFGIIHESTIPTAAVGMVVVEIGGGVGLILGLRSALIVVTVLLIVFTGVLAYGLWLGLDIDCGCFGPGADSWIGSGLQPAIWRNLVLLVGCVVIGAVWMRSAKNHVPGESL